MLKDCRRNHLRFWHSAQLYQSSNLLFSTLLFSLCFCPFSSFVPLFASHSVFVHIFYCLTSLHSLLLLPHTSMCPLTPPIILWLPFTPSITLFIPVSSTCSAHSQHFLILNVHSVIEKCKSLVPFLAPMQKWCHVIKVNPSTYVSTLSKWAKEYETTGSKRKEKAIRYKNIYLYD